MSEQSTVLMRCERCRAVISNAEAKRLIRHGVPCGVCGGTLTLCATTRHRDEAAGSSSPSDPSTPSAATERSATRVPSAERRLLGVLRDADGQPVAKQVLARAGIEDPANTIFELEQAGHRIERAYSDASDGRRRFLGYRLRRGTRQPGIPGAGGSQPSSSR